MGHIGKLSRGLKWWKNNRDLDGVLKPVIANDYDKMIDVDYFLDYVKDKDNEAVETALYQYYLLQHAEGGRKSKLYRDIKEKLDNDFKTQKEIEAEEKATAKEKAKAEEKATAKEKAKADKEA